MKNEEGGRIIKVFILAILIAIIIIFVIVYKLMNLKQVLIIDGEPVKVRRNIFNGSTKIKIGHDHFQTKNRRIVAMKAKRGKYKVKEEWPE